MVSVVVYSFLEWFDVFEIENHACLIDFSLYVYVTDEVVAVDVTTDPFVLF
jgi:hypothetical protein